MTIWLQSAGIMLQAIRERVGLGWLVGCASLGCLLPISLTGLSICGLLLLLVEWR